MYLDILTRILIKGMQELESNRRLCERAGGPEKERPCRRGFAGGFEDAGRWP